MDAKDVARRYIELSNAVDYDAMADLFAADADWIPISPIEPRTGRDAIRRGYLEQVKHTNQPIINVRYYSDGYTCVAEFEVDLGNGSMAAIVDVSR
ncbi:MAG: nuclear transport factor 2 family protein [Actinomycetota bacterium]|nr:nuclear transport factor 2 family protein [Actinomycetota bacterium]